MQAKLLETDSATRGKLIAMEVPNRHRPLFKIGNAREDRVIEGADPVVSSVVALSPD
jgi:hypothetical protein